MGYYLNSRLDGSPLPPRGKVQALIADGAKLTNPVFQPNLVCVVENGAFDAAGYCYDAGEFQAFNQPSDPRRKTWLIVPNAAQRSGYPAYNDDTNRDNVPDDSDDDSSSFMSDAMSILSDDDNTSTNTDSGTDDSDGIFGGGGGFSGSGGGDDWT